MSIDIHYNVHLYSTKFIFVRLCSFKFILVHDKKLIKLFSNFKFKLNVHIYFLRTSTNVLKNVQIRSKKINVNVQNSTCYVILQKKYGTVLFGVNFSKI